MNIDYDLVLKDCTEAFNESMGFERHDNSSHPMRCRWTDHGPLHWLAVLRNVEYLGGAQQGIDLTICRLFALVHDCQRRNEYDDPSHGARAVSFLMKNMGMWGISLDHSQTNILYYALSEHNEGYVSNNPTIGCCWDADRLDLPRVRILPKPDLMSTKLGKKIATSQDFSKIYKN